VEGGGAAILDATEAVAVELRGPRPIGEVVNKVIVLAATLLVSADGLVAFDVVRVLAAEVAPAVLAGFVGGVLAIGEQPTKVTFRGRYCPSQTSLPHLMVGHGARDGQSTLHNCKTYARLAIT